jgi:hypothetical protein
LYPQYNIIIIKKRLPDSEKYYKYHKVGAAVSNIAFMGDESKQW